MEITTWVVIGCLPSRLERQGAAAADVRARAPTRQHPPSSRNSRRRCLPPLACASPEAAGVRFCRQTRLCEVLVVVATAQFA